MAVERSALLIYNVKNDLPSFIGHVRKEAICLFSRYIIDPLVVIGKAVEMSNFMIFQLTRDSFPLIRQMSKGAISLFTRYIRDPFVFNWEGCRKE